MGLYLCRSDDAAAGVFVLLFSLSSVETERFEKAIRSLNQALTGVEGANSIIELPHEAPVKTENPEEIEEVLPATEIAEEQAEKPNENEAESQNVAIDSEWTRLTDDINQQFQVAVATDAVEIGTPKDGKLVINVKGDVLFPSGSAEFNPEMMTMIDTMVLMLRKNPDLKLRINGHTDNIPIETPGSRPTGICLRFGRPMYCVIWRGAVWRSTGCLQPDMASRSHLNPTTLLWVGRKTDVWNLCWNGRRQNNEDTSRT